MITVEVRLGRMGPVIGHMIIENDRTGTETLGNYNAELRTAHKRDDGHLTSVRIEGYPRQDYDAWELLRRVLNESYGHPEVRKALHDGPGYCQGDHCGIATSMRCICCGKRFCHEHAQRRRRFCNDAWWCYRCWPRNASAPVKEIGHGF